MGSGISGSQFLRNVTPTNSKGNLYIILIGWRLRKTYSKDISSIEFHPLSHATIGLLRLICGKHLRKDNCSFVTASTYFSGVQYQVTQISWFMVIVETLKKAKNRLINKNYGLTQRHCVLYLLRLVRKTKKNKFWDLNV